MGKRFKKLLAVLLTAATVVGSGAGSTVAFADADEEITLQFWTLALQPTFTDFIQGLIDQYEEENPNIKIDWQDLPYDGIGDKFLTATAGGNPPDVINLWSQIALTYASKGAILDVEQVITDEQRDIYLDAAYESAKVGDGIYALPWYATPNITVYNTKLLEEAGLEEFPMTYDGLMEHAAEFKEKTGAYLFNPSSMFHMFVSYGIPMLNEDHTEAAFNCPEAIELVTRLKELGDQDAIMTEPGKWDNWDNDRQLYANELLGSIVGGPQTVSRLKDESPAILEETAVRESVLGPAEISGEAIMNLCISSKTQHPVEAVDFANFITNDESQLAFCHEVSIFPTTKAAASDPFFSSDMESLEGQANYYASLSAQSAVDMTLGVEQNQDIKDIIDRIMDMVFASDMSPEDAISQAEQEVNAIL